MIKAKGPFPSSKHPRTRSGDSIGSSNLDAPPPKLRTIHRIRYDEQLKDELYGDAAKAAKAKVSLPKFSWDKGGE